MFSFGVTMLVWYYIPGGMANIPELRLRIYGHRFCHPPQEISYGLYRKYKKMLVLAPYTDEWLSKKYGTRFNSIAFMYDEIKHLPYDTLFTLAKKMGVWQRKGRPKHKTLAMLVRRSLRER